MGSLTKQKSLLYYHVRGAFAKLSNKNKCPSAVSANTPSRWCFWFRLTYHNFNLLSEFCEVRRSRNEEMVFCSCLLKSTHKRLSASEMRFVKFKSRNRIVCGREFSHNNLGNENTKPLFGNVLTIIPLVYHLLCCSFNFPAAVAPPLCGKRFNFTTLTTVNGISNPKGLNT